MTANHLIHLRGIPTRNCFKMRRRVQASEQPRRRNAGQAEPRSSPSVTSLALREPSEFTLSIWTVWPGEDGGIALAIWRRPAIDRGDDLPGVETSSVCRPALVTA